MARSVNGRGRINLAPGKSPLKATLARATLLPPDVTPKCLISLKLENDSRETRKRQCHVRRFRQEIILRESRNGIAAIQRAHPDATTGAPNSSSARRTWIARFCRSGDRRSDCPAFESWWQYPDAPIQRGRDFELTNRLRGEKLTPVRRFAGFVVSLMTIRARLLA